MLSPSVQKLFFNCCRRLLGGIVAAGLLSLCAAGCASGASSVRIETVANQPYRLQPGDSVEISIVGQSDSAVKLDVREDGSFLYPLLGKVPAAGLSLRELEELLSKQLQAESAAQAFPVSETPAASAEILSPEQASQQVYVLQPGDQLDITVWDHPDLSQKTQIRDDGMFQYPLIGEVQASGRSISDVEKEVRERFDKDYIVNPQVTVRLVGAQFSVLGQKENSGTFPIEGTVDLLTAISKAGDISTLRSSRVEIIRRQGGKQVTIRAGINRILSGQELNIPVLPRDTLYIKLPGAAGGDVQMSVQLINAKFTILGEVVNPGSYSIEGNVPLLAAISLAGGITKFGSSHVEIIRTVSDAKVVVHGNVDLVLQGKQPNPAIFPRDTLYVKRRLF